MTVAYDPASLKLPCAHFIGGELVPAEAAITVHAPSDGRRLGAIPRADAAMVDRAVRSAQQALDSSGWGHAAPRDRLRVLRRWADLMEEEADTLARLESVCSSRPFADVKTGDIPVTADQIRFFAELADKECDVLAPTAAGHLGMIASEPYGVIGAITPWNFPISMAGWKLGPALAAGNAVVLKPSELTPWSVLFMAELAVRAGLPEGLINIVQGDGAVTGNALTGHPGIGKISFTGSTRAGGQIMENIARSGIKPMTLELGGKSPMIVFADADLDLAADCLDKGITPNAGQFCVAGSRMIVAQEIAETLAERLIERFARCAPASTWDAAPGFSPLISKAHLARVDGIVTAAKAQGGDILCGGARFDHEGSFYRPTLIGDVAGDNPAVTDEIFGPVATFQAFQTEEQALELARHPTYGLCAGIFTADLGRALRLSRRIEAGTIWINRYGRSADHILPTGGWKASGMGKDLGREAFHANRRTKAILADL
ncbi:MAG: aldehyde dehydrogenase family protein [Rhodobacterales bacterium]